MSNTYVILKNNYNIYNLKAHELLTIYFKEHYIILYLNYEEIVNFLNINNLENNKIIFYVDNKMDLYEINVMNYIKSNNNIKSTIYFILFDWWKINFGGHENQNNFISNIFYANNYKVITFAYDVNQLNNFYNKDFNLYKNNILHINLWSSYNNSFSNFNNNPIKKILVSGQIYEIHYPERTQMLSLNNIEHYTYNMNDINNNIINNNNNINNNNINNYNTVLNNYIASFTSSVYIYNETEQKMVNTNMILLKTFEILASGSLLLMPISEDIYLRKIGIINKENCILLDFNKDLNEQISFILDVDNINYIDNIRYNGYLHAKNNLNSRNKFIEFQNILI
jgi:hypothetical protein